MGRYGCILGSSIQLTSAPTPHPHTLTLGQAGIARNRQAVAWPVSIKFGCAILGDGEDMGGCEYE